MGKPITTSLFTLKAVVDEHELDGVISLNTLWCMTVEICHPFFWSALVIVDAFGAIDGTLLVAHVHLQWYPRITPSPGITMLYAL
ncbi:hypothetical protein N9903_01615 [bacterium]|nr:hypothetical protein [bacterium]